MIPRYTKAPTQKIWDVEAKFQHMLQIEILSAEAMSHFNIIPKSAFEKIKTHAKFSVTRIAELEKETKHDVIAFLQNLEENIGPDARYLHRGLTSSDVLDTAFSMQLRASADVLITGVKDVLKALKAQAEAHKVTPCIGRSHGIHGEAMTFGLKLASHYACFDRHLKRLEKAKDEISYCMISGPMGNYTNIDPRIEAYVAEKLDLKVEPISTQIIPRDRHAVFFSALAMVASSIENFVTEIRHLQRTEVSEVAEGFSQKQKGSSAMPHKKNPILSENLTGLARYVRSTIMPALENMTLWHERDISHSSVERIIAPDAVIALDFMLTRLKGLIENLEIDPKRMQENIDQTKGLFYSGTILQALTDAGCEKTIAYEHVQENALKAWKEQTDFKTLIKNDKNILNYLEPKLIDKLCSTDHFNHNVNTIFQRVFKS